MRHRKRQSNLRRQRHPQNLIRMSLIHSSTQTPKLKLITICLSMSPSHLSPKSTIWRKRPHHRPWPLKSQTNLHSKTKLAQPPTQQLRVPKMLKNLLRNLHQKLQKKLKTRLLRRPVWKSMVTRKHPKIRQKTRKMSRLRMLKLLKQQLKLSLALRKDLPSSLISRKESWPWCMLETRSRFKVSCWRSTSTRTAMSWHSKRPSMMKTHASPTCRNTWETLSRHTRKNLFCFEHSTNNKWRKSPMKLFSLGNRQHLKQLVKGNPLILRIKSYGAQLWTRLAILDKKWQRSKLSCLRNLKKFTWFPLVINNQLMTSTEKLFTKSWKNSVWRNKWSRSNNRSAIYRKSGTESKLLIRKKKRCSLRTRKKSTK